ncbi:MAG: 2-hydroxychromene-2-carboxylate isomerase [Limnobacter sp.]|nr:2-hydroxychromene-2-carboxylate isomerase [Limnobacter sp.]
MTSDVSGADMQEEKFIDFYFDLTSPYSYIAAELIEAIAREGGRTVNYKPTLLGFIFQSTGNTPPMANPAKGKYSVKDFDRTARFYGLPINFPAKFPINATAATRALLKVKDDMPEKMGEFVRALYRAYFVDGRDITDAAVVGQVAHDIGLNAEVIAGANDEPEYKQKSKLAVEESIAAGMFGAPYFVVDGEAFWGQDRMEQLRKWVVEGPF